MADEKLMVSTNALNAALAKQLAKREAAPLVSDDAAASHVAALAQPVAKPATAAAGGLASFVAMWKAYYPKIVSLLGWASWVMPAQSLNAIKALLAVVNNQIIPIIEQYEKG